MGPSHQAAPTRATCARCKSQKVKCEYIGSSVQCEKCITAGLGDSCAPTQASAPPSLRQRARSTSHGPPDALASSSRLDSGQLKAPTSTVPRKRSNSGTTSHSVSYRRVNDQKSVADARKSQPVPPALPAIVEDDGIDQESADEDDLRNLPDETVQSFTLAILSARTPSDTDSEVSIADYSDSNDGVSMSNGDMEASDPDDVVQQPKHTARNSEGQPAARKKPGPKRSKAKPLRFEGPDPTTCGMPLRIFSSRAH